MKNRNAAIGFIFITLVLDVTGWGIIIPVVPKLIEELIHGDISQAAKYGGWLTATYSIVQFLFAPIMGRLSDQYGRRPILLVTLFGFALDYMVLFFAPTISWLFIARIFLGVCGASITTATAYIADISTGENRAKNFGMVGAAFGLGFIIGPVIGGLLGAYGSRVPFLAAAMLTAINFLYGLVVLPESLDKAHRRPFSWQSATPGRSLLALRKFPTIFGLMMANVLIYIAGHAVQSTWSFFTIEKFSWSEKMIGISLGVVGLLVALVQGLLIRVVHPKLGNERSVYTGFLFYSLGLFLFAFATKSWMMFAFLVPYCLGGIAQPALQSIIASSVGKSEQGELQGTVTSLVSLTSIVGPLMMTGLFSYFTSKRAPFYFPGVPFFVGGILMLLASAVAYWNLQGKHKTKAAEKSHAMLSAKDIE